MYNLLMRQFSVSAARQHLSDVVESVGEEPVMLLKHGEPAAVVISPQLYEELVSALEELEDIGMARLELKAETELARGDDLTWVPTALHATVATDLLGDGTPVPIATEISFDPTTGLITATATSASGSACPGRTNRATPTTSPGRPSADTSKAATAMWLKPSQCKSQAEFYQSRQWGHVSFHQPRSPQHACN